MLIEIINMMLSSLHLLLYTRCKKFLFNKKMFIHYFELQKKHFQNVYVDILCE